MHSTLQQILAIILVVSWSTFLTGCAKSTAQIDAPTDNRFGTAAPVQIENYSGDAMEPCISLDGKYLFFNDSNSDKVKTKIFFARRLNANTFSSAGELPGTESASKNMAPSIDAAGNFYFTSMRTYQKDAHSIFVGKFDGEQVTDVMPISGSVSSCKTPGAINMDCGISPDGNYLVVSRAQFLPGVGTPIHSQLLLSKKSGGSSFDLSQVSKNLAEQTGNFTYAPAFSTNNNELFFTTANIPEGKTQTSVVHLSADLTKVSSPRRIAAIDGFAEAPSLTQSGDEIFFHKKDNSTYRIYRAQRILKANSRENSNEP